MFVSIYCKPSLFNAHTMILIVHIFMNVNKLCLNQMSMLSCVDVEVAVLGSPLLIVHMVSVDVKQHRT